MAGNPQELMLGVHLLEILLISCAAPPVAEVCWLMKRASTAAGCREGSGAGCMQVADQANQGDTLQCFVQSCLPYLLC